MFRRWVLVVRATVVANLSDQASAPPAGEPGLLEGRPKASGGCRRVVRQFCGEVVVLRQGGCFAPVVLATISPSEVPTKEDVFSEGAASPTRVDTLGDTVTADFLAELTETMGSPMKLQGPLPSLEKGLVDQGDRKGVLGVAISGILGKHPSSGVSPELSGPATSVGEKVRSGGCQGDSGKGLLGKEMGCGISQADNMVGASTEEVGSSNQESFVPDSVQETQLEVQEKFFIIQACKEVGLTCDGEEGKLEETIGRLMADNRGKEVERAVGTPIVKKGKRELINLQSSVNFLEHSSRERNKGRASRVKS
ncbi:uncharacterized protein LOC132173407 [Corylus avellana]|uniref:uncharacterized protein LOC132173407 n=1 Tax=Corylus avellana TaxID=13451 RepID=UPI00286C52D2|nr:uncharacterized protein LOC132173407 [Corylus avellana]